MRRQAGHTSTLPVLRSVSGLPFGRVAEAVRVGYIRDMHSPPADSRPHQDAHQTPDWPSHPEIEPQETRNLLLLAAHQVVLRVGWIFKTESVIMPYFLDALTGGLGWVRGWLPTLNRLGQGVPPLFSANYLKAIRLKKRALSALVVLMSLPFVALSLIWFGFGDRNRGWMPGLFLTLYFAFFVLYGLYLVSFGTLQGKLIRPIRRGYLILLSTFWGAIPATLVALWLMPDWLGSSPPRWGHVFGLVGVCFFLSGLTVLLLSEPRDHAAKRPDKQPGSVADTFRVLRRDANLRRLVLVAVLFAGGLIIFPHYQALAQERWKLELSSNDLVIWVVTQNIAVAAFSLIVGPLADRRGYRLTLRLLIFGSAVAPAFAISLTQLPDAAGANLFWLVYIPLGVTPLVHRGLLNYALEICAPEAHPRYQSIVTFGVTVPFLLSPLVGWLVDRAGYERVFVVTVLLLLLSGLLTFRLDEPRRRVRADNAGAAGVGTPE